MIEHFWARCVHPANCSWESACYLSRGAAAGVAGAHKRKHEREGVSPGVRTAVTVRRHETREVRPGQAYCLAEAAAVTE